MQCSHKHPLYNVWNGMLQRCYNPKRENFPRYGGRGIGVCDRWRESFETFVQDMGDRPEGHTLDRINSSGDYSPENCKWSTHREQALNKGDYRNNKLGHKNIGLHKGLYNVRFRRNKRIVHVGCFKTLEEAIKARNNFLKETK